MHTPIYHIQVTVIHLVGTVVLVVDFNPVTGNSPRRYNDFKPRNFSEIIFKFCQFNITPYLINDV